MEMVSGWWYRINVIIWKFENVRMNKDCLVQSGFQENKVPPAAAPGLIFPKCS